MNKAVESTLASIALVIIVLITTSYSTIITGFTLKLLWQWFVTPFRIPPLTIPWAFGLVCVSAIVIPRSASLSDKEVKLDGQIIDMVKVSTHRCAAALLVGWIVHLFM